MADQQLTWTRVNGSEYMYRVCSHRDFIQTAMQEGGSIECDAPGNERHLHLLLRTQFGVYYVTAHPRSQQAMRFILAALQLELGMGDVLSELVMQEPKVLTLPVFGSGIELSALHVWRQTDLIDP